MITALDSSVILDVLMASPFGRASWAALRRSSREGGLVACEIVWAEVFAAFQDEVEAGRALEELAVRFDGSDEPVARAASRVWRGYRERGGPRARLVGDFLIGAHATLRADRLLTRDRGFFRSYFGELEILDPTT